MSTRDKYTDVPAPYSWEVPCTGDARFTWEYDEGRARLLSLYQKGKDKQWDAQSRIDWALDVDPQNPVGLPDEFHPLFGSPMWDSADESRRAEMRQHSQAWQFSQFLHGEQGAMVCAAKIVEIVPDLDAKFYAATQTMDEARHVETFARFLQEKVGLVYPINKHLTALLDDTLRDSRWDMPYLGMQVLIEGLALAAFGVLRDLAPQDSLAKQLLAYVMQDEARHVAFGRISLKDYYSALTEAVKSSSWTPVT
jgi:P-aminobenzoate N-oxygenase AurF